MEKNCLSLTYFFITPVPPLTVRREGGRVLVSWCRGSPSVVNRVVEFSRSVSLMKAADISLKHAHHRTMPGV